MYKVIKQFNDLLDGLRCYQPGDVYPREGYEPAPERIQNLLTNNNPQGEPLIKEQKGKKKNVKQS